MRLLWQRGAMPVRDIGTALALDYGTLSPLLKRLESAGLVTRRRRVDDERSVEVALTDGGRAMEARSLGVPTKLTCALGLGDAESTDLRRAARAAHRLGGGRRNVVSVVG